MLDCEPIQWSKTRNNLCCIPNTFWWDWLSRPYKLSEAFRRVASTLTVEVISQGFDFILQDEAAYFDLKLDQKFFLRQVYVLGDNNRFEYARVIIPDQTYAAYFQQFEGLGKNLIGENILYEHPNMRRTAFEYTALKSHDLRYIKALENFNGGKPFVLWARRSIFYLDNLPLSVMEVFLPDIPVYQPKS